MTFILNFIRRLIGRLETVLVRSCLGQLKHAGQGIVLGRGVKIEYPECVSLGDNVHLNDYCWLSVVTQNFEVGRPTVSLKPELSIGNGSYIGRFGTLACINRLTIGHSVMISDRVFIGDAAHGYARTDLPIRDQYMTSKGPIEIGDGTWIGIGVSVVANVKIGRNCVIGAGSVVTHDIPDFSIAAGVPAKVLRSIDG
jgi:bifunctional N-acetylglucosamine-1-phosphate-uridyltransferase/glucosamine-1-phosphate-acetyltransferase GlmU-like protein